MARRRKPLYREPPSLLEPRMSMSGKRDPSKYYDFLGEQLPSNPLTSPQELLATKGCAIAPGTPRLRQFLATPASSFPLQLPDSSRHTLGAPGSSGWFLNGRTNGRTNENAPHADGSSVMDGKASQNSSIVGRDKSVCLSLE